LFHSFSCFGTGLLVPGGVFFLAVMAATPIVKAQSSAASSSSTASATANAPVLQKGKQSYLFTSADLRMPAPITVWMYSPTDRPDTLPVVIMLHGAERNASGYLDQWARVADLYQLVVLAPTFDKENFKGSDRYNLGNVWNEKQVRFSSEREWTFSAIEPMFDQFVKAVGSRQQAYYLSGHSAGAQFVHRFLYFVSDNRAAKVFISNAGWYTLPDVQNDYPFGIRNIPQIKKNIQQVFSKPVLLALGEADIDTTSANFQRGEPYSLQGANRFERGKNFFRAMQTAAGAQGTSLGWTMISLPGVAHSNAETAKQAGAFFRSVHYPTSTFK
jgi:poly(3-hydroxybutyrate) depolymerase